MLHVPILECVLHQAKEQFKKLNLKQQLRSFVAPPWTKTLDFSRDTVLSENCTVFYGARLSRQRKSQAIKTAQEPGYQDSTRARLSRQRKSQAIKTAQEPGYQDSARARLSRQRKSQAIKTAQEPGYQDSARARLSRQRKIVFQHLSELWVPLSTILVHNVILISSIMSYEHFSLNNIHLI